MAPRDDQHSPLQNLESPFLSGELFGAENESNWDAQLNLLEAESPFLHAFEDSSMSAPALPLYTVGSEGFGAPIEAPIESEIFGSNDMDGVANHLAMPFRWICRLDIQYEITPWNSTRKLNGHGRGTGTLISPCHILTAAHNVSAYDPAGRNFLRATRIQATPAHDGSARPAVATVDVEMSTVRVHRFWRPANRVDGSGNSNAAGEVSTNRYDYALLTLKRPIGQSTVAALGGPLGSWSQQGSGGSALFERVDPTVLRSNPVNVSGYGYDACVDEVRRARSKPGISYGSQLTASGQLALIMEGTGTQYVGRSMAHNVDTCGGQSGAPVWMQRNGKFYLVGIHTGGVGLVGGGRMNHAVRVTAEVITQVNDWMAQSPCPVSPADLEGEGPIEGEALYLGEGEGDAEFDDAEYGDTEFDEMEALAWEDEGAQTQVQRQYEDSPYMATFMEGETGSDMPIARMKFELQSTNRIYRNDGNTSSLLDRKYGPNDFLVDNKGVRLESETHGVLEFETEWLRTLPNIVAAIEKAVKMTGEINGAPPSKFNKARKAFPFDVTHLRRATAKERAQGYWDRRRGMEGDREKILGANEELEIELLDSTWRSGIQSSESFLLEYYESFLRQHEWPHYRDGAINHAEAILDAVNKEKRPITEIAKLRSLIQIIVNYIMRGQGGKESKDAGAFDSVKGMPSKQAFTLLCRTNFASIYRVLLTDKERMLFQRIIKTNAVLTEMGLNRQSMVFIDGYGTKQHQPGPTVYEWLRKIPAGIDLLSTRSGKGISNAMGRYVVEIGRGKKDRWHVKFETRNTIMGAWVEAKDWVKYVSDLFDLASKRERHALHLLSQLGITDENKLANFVFSARHPDLKGRPIRKYERTLAKEWLKIRDELVRTSGQSIQPELEQFEGLENRYDQFSPSDVDVNESGLYDIDEEEYDDELDEEQFSQFYGNEVEESEDDFLEEELERADNQESIYAEAEFRTLKGIDQEDYPLVSEEQMFMPGLGEIDQFQFLPMEMEGLGNSEASLLKKVLAKGLRFEATIEGKTQEINIPPTVVRSPYLPDRHPESQAYKALSTDKRAKIAATVDAIFKKETGIVRKLDPNNPRDRHWRRIWLTLRDIVMRVKVEAKTPPTIVWFTEPLPSSEFHRFEQAIRDLESKVTASQDPRKRRYLCWIEKLKNPNFDDRIIGWSKICPKTSGAIGAALVVGPCDITQGIPVDQATLQQSIRSVSDVEKANSSLHFIQHMRSAVVVAFELTSLPLENFRTATDDAGRAIEKLDEWANAPLGGSSAMPQAYRSLKDWIMMRQKDPKSLYSCF